MADDKRFGVDAAIRCDTCPISLLIGFAPQTNGVGRIKSSHSVYCISLFYDDALNGKDKPPIGSSGRDHRKLGAPFATPFSDTGVTVIRVDG